MQFATLRIVNPQTGEIINCQTYTDNQIESFRLDLETLKVICSVFVDREIEIDYHRNDPLHKEITV